MRKYRTPVKKTNVITNLPVKTDYKKCGTEKIYKTFGITIELVDQQIINDTTLKFRNLFKGHNWVI